jgi:site-specific DNA-cytosine methylase
MQCQQEFSAEIDARMRDFSALNFAPAMNVYTDVNKLPRSIPEVHLLIFGSSCRGLSLMNMKRRCLGHQDANNPLHTSGATMTGCLEYVRHRRPRVLLLENVRGLLAVSAILSQPGRPVRNIDHVMSTLKSLGYTCGHTSVDSRKFLLPQSRPRIWVWAEHGGGDEAQQFWTRLLARMQFAETFSVESLLVH